MGGQFESDGRLQGTQETQTIECDQTNNQCVVPVRAPSFALVFLTDDALARSTMPQGSAPITFATTATTNANNRPQIAPAVLATMNGDGGPSYSRLLGSTGLTTSGAGVGARPALGMVVGLVGFLLAIHGLLE